MPGRKEFNLEGRGARRKTTRRKEGSTRRHGNQEEMRKRRRQVAQSVEGRDPGGRRDGDLKGEGEMCRMVGSGREEGGSRMV